VKEEGRVMRRRHASLLRWRDLLQLLTPAPGAKGKVRKTEFLKQWAQLPPGNAISARNCWQQEGARGQGTSAVRKGGVQFLWGKRIWVLSLVELSGRGTGEGQEGGGATEGK